MSGPGSGRRPGGARHIKDQTRKKFRKSISPGLEPMSMAKNFAAGLFKGRSLRLANKAVDRAYERSSTKSAKSWKTGVKVKYTQVGGLGRPGK